MRLVTPELLLVIYLFLPVGTARSRPLAAQILLSQIKAIRIARQAEQKFYSEEDDEEAFKDLLLALLFDPGQTTAYAYLGLCQSRPIFLSHQNGDRISCDTLKLIGQTNPNVTIACEITACLSCLGGVVSIGVDEDKFFETEVTTDEYGKFEIEISLLQVNSPGTRYTIFAIESNTLARKTGTQITLIHR